MSLFKNLFKSDASENEKPALNWIPLTEMSQLDTIKSLSEEKPVLIFKHSTRCGISSMVLKNFERSFDIDSNIMAIYFLDLLQYRALSNEIATVFQIQHQSPQAIVISKGKIVYADSHSGISVEAIKKVI
jgi:bacillithiol system protein YtxJ